MTSDVVIGKLFNRRRYMLTVEDIIDYMKETTENFTLSGTEWMVHITEEQWVEIFIICCKDMQDKLRDVLAPNMKEIIEG